MGSAEDPAWLQLLQKDPSLLGPQPIAFSCPQDGSLGAGRPAMRDCFPSQEKASPVLTRHIPDQGPGMDSRHSSPTGAVEDASCSEGPGGSLACLTPTYIPPQEAANKGTLEAHEASVSGTPEIPFSGKSEISKAEPVLSVKMDHTSSENRNPMFLEKVDFKSSKKADSTSTAKEDARPPEKTDPTIIGQTESAILGKGDLVSSGKMDTGSLGKEGHMPSSKVNTVSPRKEGPNSLRKVDPVSLGKVEPAFSKKEDDSCSGKEHLVSSEKVCPASSGKADHGPSGKMDSVSLENTGSASAEKTDPASLGKLTPGSSGETDPVSLRTVDLGSSGKGVPTGLGMADPMSRENVETVSSIKEDPKILEKMDPTSSGKGDSISVRVMKTVSAEQVDAVFSGKVDPTSIKNVERIASDKGPVSLGKVNPMSLSSRQAELISVGETNTASSGKEVPVFSTKVDPISVGNIKASTSGKENPESSGKIDSLSSAPGDPKSLGTVGHLSSIKAETVTAESAGPQSLDKADPVASQKVLGKVDPVKTRGEAEVDSMSLGKVDPVCSGKAEAGPEMKVHSPLPETGNPVNSRKVDSSAFGKAELTSESKPELKSPGKESPTSSGKTAVASQKNSLNLVDPSSGKADPVASGEVAAETPGKVPSEFPRKAETPALEKVTPLTLGKAEASSRKLDGQPRGTVPSPQGVGSSSGVRPVSMSAPHTEASSLSPNDSTASGTTKSSSLEAFASRPGPRTRDNFTKAPSWEASALPPPPPPPREDAGTQAGAQACVSVAVSPMSPQDGAGGPAFSFQAAPRAPSPTPRPPSRRDAGLQVSLGTAETRSVATGPMTPQAAAPPVFPEVRVRPGSVLAAAVTPPEAAEPVRDVSWDEKGMTWEVYGASMEVEVLGMAIQKHLERQIEEHGRQGAPAPPSATRPGPGRSGSVRAVPPEGAVKRPPGLFRALLQSVRRPRCCSRAGPTAE